MCFIERIVEVSQSSVQLQNLRRPFDITEKKIIDDTIQNFKLCKQLYMSLHNTIGDNLLKYINNCPILVRGKMDEDMRRDTFYLINFQKVINMYDYFYTLWVNFLAI